MQPLIMVVLSLMPALPASQCLWGLILIPVALGSTHFSPPHSVHWYLLQPRGSTLYPPGQLMPRFFGCLHNPGSGSSDAHWACSPSSVLPWVMDVFFPAVLQETLWPFDFPYNVSVQLSLLHGSGEEGRGVVSCLDRCAPCLPLAIQLCQSVFGVWSSSW